MDNATPEEPISTFRNTTTEYNKHSSTELPATDAHRGVAKDMEGRSIGGMPIHLFLDSFLPDHKKTPLGEVDIDFFKTIPESGHETKRYLPFVKLMNGCSKITSLSFVRTSTKKESGSGTNMSPDIVVYVKVRGKRTPTALSWSSLEMYVEWKPDDTDDCYRKIFVGEEVLDLDAEKHSQTRGQIYSYAAKALDSQHRGWILALSVFGQFFRVYRFDPSSVVVSEPISFRDHPEMMVEIFARFGCMTPAERGHDTTVIPSTAAEKKLFRDQIRDYKLRVEEDNLRLHPDVKGLDSTKVVRIRVNNEGDGATHWYLACKPGSLHPNRSPCGRLSRGFLAMPLKPGPQDKGKLYWLKDCWRSDQVESEASIYRRLKAGNVRNIPNILCMGDVLQDGVVQETFNDTLLDDEDADSWRRPVHIIYHMVHYRLVSELLIPINCVEDAEDLLLVGRDILSAISTARSEVGVSHRDVSRSNVMMTESRDDPQGRSGILNDWDHAKQVGTQPVDWVKIRTACWQFLSVALLSQPTKPHDIFDDLESLYWVLVYVGAGRFVYDGKLPESLFDQIDETPNKFMGIVSSGGEKKLNWLEVSKICFKSAELEKVLTKYRIFFKDYENMVTNRETYRQALHTLRENPQESIRTLVSFFEDVLSDEHNDWDNSAAIGAPPKPLRPNARNKVIRQSIHRSTANGLWRGASGWRRPTTTPVLGLGQAVEDSVENGRALGTVESAVGGESISFRLAPVSEDQEDEVESSTDSETEEL